MPLFGTRKLDRLEENLGALDVQLTPEEFEEVDRLSSGFKVQGDAIPRR